MATWRIICRTHDGGVISMPARKGRKPVRCGGAGVPECDKANGVTNIVRDVPEAPRTQANPSLPLAMAAKERLSSMGWVVKGKAFVDDEGTPYAHVIASRGAETLVMEWQNGKLIDQQYSMEDVNPTKNGYPPSQLSFNPDELTDSELLRMLRGMKVTWYNTIASSTETAIIGGNVTFEHIFYEDGDEDNSKRIIKFLDHGGGGFRAFHIGALVKVG